LKVLIKAYGVFWRADEIDWRPGRGSPFRLVGRNDRDEEAKPFDLLILNLQLAVLRIEPPFARLQEQGSG